MISKSPFTYTSCTFPHRAAIKDADGNSIASLIGLAPTRETMDSNGRLFAAAPDLLEALKELVKEEFLFEHEGSKKHKVLGANRIKAAWKAIAKAEGEDGN